MNLRHFFFPERQNFIVSDVPDAQNSQRLADVLDKAGARNVHYTLVFNDESKQISARASLNPRRVGYIESNGFTVTPVPETPKP